ncbi:hypothetical protein [Haloglomus salinum]|jgi:hypothetical protein|uniref:hypothetical protein n=1 Tax=Haloglomus salinum TaxID=2962673 RepID=UPI0020C93BE0|nr:hypothetical protein [Haloglomus salinum]
MSPAGAPGRWFLLTGNRRAVTLLLLGVVYVALVPMALVFLGSEQLLAARGTIAGLLNTLLSGVILLVSIVVSVTSLFVSQELSPVGRQRERVERAREFRESTEDILDREVSPARPSAFLRAVTQGILERTQDLQDAVDAMAPGHPGLDEGTEGDPAAEIDAFRERVAADVEAVNRRLSDGAGTFGILLAGLEYDYAGQLYALRRFRSRHGTELTEEVDARLEDVVAALEFFVTAREYFKSLYFEREFATLSRDLLFVSLPALVLVSYAILAIDAEMVGGTTIGVSRLLLLAGGAYTLALAPFAVLTAYVVRVSTIAISTLSAGPFVLADDDPDDLVE